MLSKSNKQNAHHAPFALFILPHGVREVLHMDKHLVRNRKVVAFFPTDRKKIMNLTNADRSLLVQLARINAQYQKAHQNGQPLPEDLQKFTNADYLIATQGLNVLAKLNGYRAVWLMSNRPQSWRIH